MEELIAVNGKPKHVRLDNGPELTAEAFADWARKRYITLRFIKTGKLNQNAAVEFDGIFAVH
jgi:putative transposase